MKQIVLPDQSPAAAMAAKAIDSPCVVIASLNAETDQWDVRCFGGNDRWRYASGFMAEIIVSALAKSDPPKEWEQAFTLLDGGSDAE